MENSRWLSEDETVRLRRKVHDGGYPARGLRLSLAHVADRAAVASESLWMVSAPQRKTRFQAEGDAPIALIHQGRANPVNEHDEVN